MWNHSVLAVAMPALLGCIAFAQRPVSEQPPFSASPQALQAAFATIDPGSHPVTVLFEEGRLEFDSSGRSTYRYRIIFKAWTKAGAENWAMIERNWAPWREERPSVQARVIGQDGSVNELDPKTIADSPVRDGDDD